LGELRLLFSSWFYLCSFFKTDFIIANFFFTEAL